MLTETDLPLGMHGLADHRRGYQGINSQPLLRTVPSRELAPSTHPFVSLRDQGPPSSSRISPFFGQDVDGAYRGLSQYRRRRPALARVWYQGLRIVDASVFPNQVSGHPAAVVAAVAEKAADIIKSTDA